MSTLEIANPLGTWRRIQLISLPPPGSPVFCTLRSIAVATPAVNDVGAPAIVQDLAAAT
jgi:hypothetical protein